MQCIHPVMRTAVLAVGVGFAAFAFGQAALAADGEGGTMTTNPGFKADGQINPGKTEQAPSSSTDVRKIPSAAESRAAKMSPDRKDPAPGQATSSPGGSGGGGTAQKESLDAIGGPLTPGGSAANGGSSGSGGGAKSDTTGLGSSNGIENWPIGSTGQTVPAKFNQRNDTLDRTPMMALPMPLSDQDRQRIYNEVMADKSQVSADAADLQPASQLSTAMVFNDMHPLPQTLSDVAWIKKLDYVKTKDKVLLVEPETRTVVDLITQ